MTTQRLINRGLYRTPDNSFIMFRWRRHTKYGKPFAELVNIVTGDCWNMALHKAKTQRYLDRLTYTGAKVQCRLNTTQAYSPPQYPNPDFSRGYQ